MRKSLMSLLLCAPLLLVGCGGSSPTPPPASTSSTTASPNAQEILPIGNVAAGPAFTLTVTGSGFLSSSVVNFGGTAVATTFVNSTWLTATIPAAAIASAGTRSVTVANAASGGSTSNPLNFTIYPSSSGTFTATGSMATQRAEHTATLLLNGKVLIAGGWQDRTQPLASAELYDPSTGKFAPTGNMNTARHAQTATLLTNGKVLIAGGWDLDGGDDAPLASAELYDPSTGVFTSIGSMPAIQAVVSATLLPDGRVLIAGWPGAAIYDPVAGSFAPAGAYVNVGANPQWITSTLLQDGRVLLAGCGAQCTVAATELFDPKSGAFSTTGQIGDWQDTATLLTNGRVLFVGNNENDGSLADAEVYDPAAGAFTSNGKALAPHEFAASVLLNDGRVLITGGQLPGGDGHTTGELFLPASGTFTFANNMMVGRHEHTATLLPDGTVLIVGGYNIWPSATATAEIYKP